jgi:hypothetical protein
MNSRATAENTDALPAYTVLLLHSVENNYCIVPWGASIFSINGVSVMARV